MKKILVPTDFSENAQKAALFAVEIAKRANADVYFLNAMELGFEGIHETFPLHEKYNKAVMQNREQEMSVFMQGIREAYNGIHTETEIESAEAVPAILDFTQLHAIDLIVMGTKGAGIIKEKLVGTTAANVITASKVPVLVIPMDYQVEKPDGILFTTKNFEKDSHILNMIILLARLFAATVHVVQFTDTDDISDELYLENKRKLEDYLHYLSASYTDVSFRGEIIQGDEFDEAVEHYHSVHKTDIAAMITYPRGFWERFFNKSVTRKMVFHSSMPVLAIPAV